MFNALSSVFSVFSGSKTKINDFFTSQLVGGLFHKQVGSKPKCLSSVCNMTLSLVGEVSYEYNLNIQNLDKTKSKLINLFH